MVYTFCPPVTCTSPCDRYTAGQPFDCTVARRRRRLDNLNCTGRTFHFLSPKKLSLQCTQQKSGLKWSFCWLKMMMIGVMWHLSCCWWWVKMVTVNYYLPQRWYCDCWLDGRPVLSLEISDDAFPWHSLRWLSWWHLMEKKATLLRDREEEEVPAEVPSWCCWW